VVYKDAQPNLPGLPPLPPLHKSERVSGRVSSKKIQPVHAFRRKHFDVSKVGNILSLNWERTSFHSVKSPMNASREHLELKFKGRERVHKRKKKKGKGKRKKSKLPFVVDDVFHCHVFFLFSMIFHFFTL